MAEQFGRKLAAILALDVVGYSRRLGADEGGTLERLRTLRREVIDPAIAQHGGRIFKIMGDGLLSEFPSAVEALRCAVAVQRQSLARNATLGEPERLELRVGLHQGDVVIEDGDLLGDGVNVAARLEAMAEPGGICISGRVREDAAGKLPLQLQDLGPQPLKNIAEPVRVFRVRLGAATGAWKPALAEPDVPSLAVLPFQTMSSDAEQDYFADGVVEDLITALSRVGWFFVIARNSSFIYKGRPVEATQVGRELGVRYVLRGSLRRAGSRVRINGQLIEAATGRHIWADRFDGDLADIFELQDRITESVVGAIEPNMRLAEIARARAKPTASLDAYEFYLRALPCYYAVTQEGYETALALLERAIAADPGYAMAKAFLAFVLVTRNGQGWSGPGDRECSVGMAREALAANRDDPNTLRCAGHALGFWTNDDDAALAAVDRAVRLNGNSAQVLSSAGWVHLYAGDPAPAVGHFRRALQLSPLDPEAPLMHAGMGWAHLMLEEDEEALLAAQASVREMPNWLTGYRTLLMSLVRLGRLEEARDAARRMLQLDPGYRLSKNVRPFRHAKFSADYDAALRLVGLPE